MLADLSFYISAALVRDNEEMKVFNYASKILELQKEQNEMYFYS